MTGLQVSRMSQFFSPLGSEFVPERYTVAIATAVLAIVLRWFLDPLLGHVAFYVTVYAAVAFTALTCGLGPAVLSAVAGILGIFYWFVDPRHSVSVSRPSELHGFIGCFFVCTVLIALGDTNRRKQLQLNRSIHALTAEAAQRRLAQACLKQAHAELEQRIEERTIQLSRALSRVESEVLVRKQAEEQLRQLSVRLMSLQDEERRKLARDLHDTAGQTLAAIKMISASIQQLAADTPDILRLLQELNAFTDEALQEIRTTSYLLHPPLLDEAGIASAARWFVEGFGKRSGIKASCEIADDFERPQRHCELVLFRVLQETLTNVHRHSGASAAVVRLYHDLGCLKLEILDNGNGISNERLAQLGDGPGSGVGILGMKERLHELHGRLEIHSSPAGTNITVTLPLHKPAAVSSSLRGTSSAA